MDELVRGNVVMTLSEEQLKTVELTVDDGSLDCARNEDKTYVCTNVTPVKPITAVCVDSHTNVAITGNADLTSRSFSTDAWPIIIEGLRSGVHPYEVGDTKEIDMGTLGKHTVRLSNLTPCDSSLESTSACGAVIEFADIISKQQINNKSEGSWPATKVRKYLNETVYNALPSDLRSGIINTTVVTGHNSNESTNYTSTDDKIYLLSTKEVWEQGASNIIDCDTARESTRQLDYYKKYNVTTNDYSKAIKENSSWWLRTPYATNTNKDYLYVTADGNWDSEKGNKKFGVSPAFRLA